jgi:tetratricopeptide (TPR) repeat protein
LCQDGVTVKCQTSSSFSSSCWAILLAGGVIVFAALMTYHNSFSTPFLFDDRESIAGNMTIRHLWPVWPVLSPPQNTTVSGRPLINLSLAINYACSGMAVGSYHVVNLAVHIFAGLTLFGIVRRTMLQPALRERYGAAALPLALAIALLWLVHPLQTESVTYVVQRAESLMGLFYLLTLYCFIRATDPGGSGLWYGLAVAACLLGMTSKEVMVSSPLIVLLYDRTFVAGSFRAAWRRRWRFYLCLMATWFLLADLVMGTGGRNGTAGFDTTVSWWLYALTQFRAIVHYLQLALWPYPLVFDYGDAVLAKSAAEIAPCFFIILLLATATIISVWRWPAIGFLGCSFFAILAPSSSVVPVTTELMAEHRLYLPLAVVATLAVMAIYRLVGRRSVMIFLALAVVLGFLASRRNEDYRNEMSILADTVAKCPNNARAHYNYAVCLSEKGLVDEAIAQFRDALEIQPDEAKTLNNLGTVLLLKGQADEAIDCLQRALAIHPDFAEAWYNLGNAFFQKGQVNEAIACYQKNLEIRPDFAPARNNLGTILFHKGEIDGAIAQFQEALTVQPDFALARTNLEKALVQKQQK